MSQSVIAVAPGRGRVQNISAQWNIFFDDIRVRLTGIHWMANEPIDAEHDHSRLRENAARPQLFA
jgi:hypothetical protein